MPTVLLAANEAWLRVVVRAALVPAHRLVEAWNDQQALDLAQRERPRLALLDATAPEMNGWEVCRGLKSDPATRHIAVVMLTSGREPTEVGEDGQDEADARLGKPFSRLALLEVVERLLGSDAARGEQVAAAPDMGGVPEEPDPLDQALVYARDLSALYQAARDQADRFRGLVEMGRELVAACGLDTLLRLALERATVFSGYDGGSVLLLAGSEGPLEVRASVGPDPAPVGARVDDLARSVAG